MIAQILNLSAKIFSRAVCEYRSMHIHDLESHKYDLGRENLYQMQAEMSFHGDSKFAMQFYVYYFNMLSVRGIVFSFF